MNAFVERNRHACSMFALIVSDVSFYFYRNQQIANPFSDLRCEVTSFFFVQHFVECMHIYTCSRMYAPYKCSYVYTSNVQYYPAWCRRCISSNITESFFSIFRFHKSYRRIMSESNEKSNENEEFNSVRIMGLILVVAFLRLANICAP